MTSILSWLAAATLPGIGVATVSRWLEKLNSIDAIFQASSADLKNAELRPSDIQAIQSVNWQIVKRDARWCQDNDCTLIPLLDESFPALLKEIHDPPLLLYVQGDKNLLSQPQIAIVGSRNPSMSGMDLAAQFAKQLAQLGLVVTSGLARGIDTAAHQGALASGKTIAVLGTGLQHIYPGENRTLAKEIIKNGALISEFPLGTPPKAKNFPLRNRLISGLSLGVLVVEAALKSGSLITARQAMEQNREVFALPGSIHHPLSRGCHQLIRQGATLVETANDILQELGAFSARLVPTRKPDASHNEVDIDPTFRPVLAQIGYETTALDVIIERSQLTKSEVSSMLLSLELMGYINVVVGGYVRSSHK